MNARKLTSNSYLALYLDKLSSRLHCLDEFALADNVAMARRFAGGSASEFLHEAQVALTKVSESSCDKRDDEEKSEIATIIQQIADAFREVGGA